MRFATSVLLLALLLGGCDNGDPVATDEATPTPTVTEPAPGECFDPSSPTIVALAEGITVGGSILAITAALAEDDDDVWYVAAELGGEGYEDPGDVALWATEEDPSEEATEFVAVNALAIEESDWDPDRGIDEKDPAVDKLFDCVDERF